MEALTLVFPTTTMFLISLWFLYAYRLYRPEGYLPKLDENGCKIRHYSQISIYNVTKNDILPMLGITILYACVAFFMLGDTEAPQSLREYEANEVSVFDFGETTSIDEMMFFTSLHTGDYTLEYSMDGENYFQSAEMTQNFNELFKWREIEFDAPILAKYVKISANARLDLAEIAFINSDGEFVVPNFSANDAALFDEQHLAPIGGPTYMNGSYFDEIYHARTAFEHIKNVAPYEISHPPLGKLIISLGIDMFGMTPFGWRFMGTLFGVMMLPVLYILVKLLFGSTAVSAAATFIFAFDFMHYVQTRIATIDTYAVFFTMLTFLLMFLFVRGKNRREQLISLALCGIFWGVGCASKWTVIYAGAGLGVIWFGYWICRFVALRSEGNSRKFYGEFFCNALYCVVFFIVAPLTIYYLSYYPYGAAEGMSGIAMYFDKQYFDIVIENQKFMFSYHSDLVATHPYSSLWWQWVLDLRPILYYLDYVSDSTKSAFGAFGGPILYWGGLVSMLYMFFRTVYNRDFRAFMISAGYLAALLPWVLIERLTFAYHYFPSTVFLALAVAYVLSLIIQKTANWQPFFYSACGASAVLFLMFYPVLSGLPFSRWYTSTFLRWIPDAWPF